MPNLAIDHQQPLSVSLVVETLHVVAYRLWVRTATDASWTIVGSGTTEDDVTDAYVLGTLGSGAAVAYWMAVSGPTKSSFEAQLVFSQDNQVVHGGTVWITGKTDAQGVAIVGDGERVVFP